jgi:hypothetical protein
MLVGCVSFDWHPGSPFSHIGDACCYLVYVNVFYPFDTAHSLSAEARPLLYRQQHSLSLSISSEGHLLDLCAQMSPTACPVRRR